MGIATQKALPLNILQPTKVKDRMLGDTYRTFFSMVEEALQALDGVRSRGQLHKETYERLVDRYGVASTAPKSPSP
ncbi:MAG: hypothetical protein ACE5Z5_09755 [Candidatus Bathyarchaeia archaeon]